MRLLLSALQRCWSQLPCVGMPPLGGHTGGSLSHWLMWEACGKDCGGWMNKASADSPWTLLLDSHFQMVSIVVSSQEIWGFSPDDFLQLLFSSSGFLWFLHFFDCFQTSL